MSSLGSNWLNRIWYEGAPAYQLLLPLSWAYAAALRIRSLLFDRRVLRTVSVSVPVVVVGNITVGGTGKTPVVLWLAASLAERGYAPGIILRGYRGNVGPRPVLVMADSDPAMVGDEALLLARRSKLPVVVHPDRVAAAELAIRQGVNILISDDGLQHRRLGRQFEIVVVDGARGFGNGQLLPAGPLRESTGRLAIADEVIVQGDDTEVRRILRQMHRDDPYNFTLRPAKVMRLGGSAASSLSDFSGKTVHALAGIGNPERFFEMLESHSITLCRHPLPDHASITQDMLDFGDELDIIMTEKDAVKCAGLDTARCWYVPVSLQMDEQQERALLDHLVQRTGILPAKAVTDESS